MKLEGEQEHNPKMIRKRALAWINLINIYLSFSKNVYDITMAPFFWKALMKYLCLI
tara:strand:+ start:364 stop:531 length:168 start_codon:yes stop_codon:yes gene_type:complete